MAHTAATALVGTLISAICVRQIGAISHLPLVAMRTAGPATKIFAAAVALMTMRLEPNVSITSTELKLTLPMTQQAALAR